MGFFSKLGELMAPRAATETQGTRWRGASRTLRSLVSWMPVIGSATSDLPATELKTLRARSRDAFRGDLLARAALLRPRTSVVGTGLMCRPSVDHAVLGMTEEAAEAIDAILRSHWNAWAEDPVECDAEATLDFYGLEGLALLSAMASGDVFALTPYEVRPGGAYGLKVQLIEADRISNPSGQADSDTLIDGVVVDGPMPVRYWICSTHPGDKSTTGLPTWTAYEAFGAATGRRRVLHVWNDKERPGQIRGAPYLAPILEPLIQLRRYGLAELMAAVVSGLMTVFIEKETQQTDGSGNPLPAFVGQQQTDAGEPAKIELGNGAVVDLAPGEKPAMVNPSRPNANFDPFFVAVVKQIGAALEIPLDELLLHYDASYSAARAAMLQAWRFYLLRRWRLTQEFCQPIYNLFVDELVATGRVNLPNYADPIRRRAFCRAVWVGPARGSMDEEKEANAAKTRIEIGVSNESIETMAMTGEDWTTVYAQRRREKLARRHDEVLDPNNYGIATRAGLVTPNLADETAFRENYGLPAVSQDVVDAWVEDGGVRRPITLQAEQPPPTQPGTTPENPA